MRFKGHNPNINRPIVVYGINLMDLIILIVAAVVLLLLSGVLNVFTSSSVPSFVFLVVVILLGMAFMVLRKANKKGHRQYLLSWLSFRFFQPKRIKHLRIR